MHARQLVITRSLGARTGGLHHAAQLLLLGFTAQTTRGSVTAVSSRLLPHTQLWQRVSWAVERMRGSNMSRASAARRLQQQQQHCLNHLLNLRQWT
jgi:hypothetical protein